MVLILLAYLGARYEFRDDLLPRIQRSQAMSSTIGELHSLNESCP
jgi:hypothetical protein